MQLSVAIIAASSIYTLDEDVEVVVAAISYRSSVR